MKKQPPRSVSDEAFEASKFFQNLDPTKITPNDNTVSSSPDPPVAVFGKLSPEDVAEELGLCCQIDPPAPQLENLSDKIPTGHGAVGCRTYLKQTFQLFALGLSRKEIDEVNGCGDLVDLIKNKLKAAKKRRCGKK